MNTSNTMNRRWSVRTVLLAVLLGCAVMAGCSEDTDESEASDALPNPLRTVENSNRADTVSEVEPWSAASVESRTIPAGGLQRDYILSLPKGAQQREGLPLILVFHGYTSTAASMQRTTGLNNADAVVAYLQGVNKAWAPAPYANTNARQDLQFADAVREQLQQEFHTQPARTFAVGFSNGGGFAEFLSCQRPQDYTAVATVSAAIYDSVLEGCSAIPLTRLDIHGTSDNVIDYQGGTRHKTHYAGAYQDVEREARRNHCKATDDEAPKPEWSEVLPGVEKAEWSGCDAGLVHYKIEGGKHEWLGPGTTPASALPIGFASEAVLRFFGVGVQK